jgi:hypothetical protein
MRQKKLKKTIFTLNVDNYAPEITELTFPLLKYYAAKIGAEFRVISERKFPDWPIVYEKLQIHELGKGYDWVYYFDADCLVHPECIDFSWHLDDDVCMHNAQDMAHIRFRYDEHFQKDGRNIGTCGWFVLTPAKCLDLWKPTEQSLAEVIDCCYPTVGELNSGLIDKGHLVDDYVKSRNICKFGLKHDTVANLLPRIGLEKASFLWHKYMIPEAQKVQEMREVLRKWQVPREIMSP